MFNETYSSRMMQSLYIYVASSNEHEFKNWANGISIAVSTAAVFDLTVEVAKDHFSLPVKGCKNTKYVFKLRLDPKR
jgi:hypothetical protein